MTDRFIPRGNALVDLMQVFAGIVIVFGMRIHVLIMIVRVVNDPAIAIANVRAFVMMTFVVMEIFVTFRRPRARRSTGR